MDLKFSQRMGLTPVEKQIQLTSIDDDLRNGLWDVFKKYILDSQPRHATMQFASPPALIRLYQTIWHHFYKKPIDKIPPNADVHIRVNFFSNQWYEVYDLLEFVNTLPSFEPFVLDLAGYKENCNRIFKRESAGYRFLGDHISPVTNVHEIQQVQEALNHSDNFTSLKGVNIHLSAALTYLSNRKDPDYRNSIKESISAIESLAKSISGNTKDTLGASLDKIKGQIKLHASLEKGFKLLYGYTSDSSGIRHALTDVPDCDFEDAKYMLVSCSAFVNYLMVKAEKAGIAF